MTDEKIEYINKNNILVIFFKDDLLHYLIDILNKKPNTIFPKLTNGDNIMINKYTDYKLFSIYKSLNKIENYLINEDIFQMYYRKYHNFININIKNKLYLNLSELLLNYNEIIEIISKQSGISIYKKLSEDYKKYPEYKNILNQDYLNNLSKFTLDSFFNKRDNLIEKKWNELITFKKDEYDVYLNKDYAVIYYFDNMDNLFKLKLSIYLLQKNFTENLDIFIYYTNIKEENIFINHNIRYIKFDKDEIELFNPDLILKYFKNYENILFLEYDFFINENILNKIEINTIDYYLFDVKSINLNKKYKIINKILNKDFFKLVKCSDSKRNNNEYIINTNNKKFLFFNINFFKRLELNEYFKIFKILKEKNISLDKTDLTIYLNHLEDIIKYNLNFDYFDSSLR